MNQLRYHRVLLKLSGEALGRSGQGIEIEKLNNVAEEIKALHTEGVELLIVMGAGNWWRKRKQGKGYDPVVADYMGIISTDINALALRDALNKKGVKCEVFSHVGTEVKLINKISRGAIEKSLKARRVVVLAGGTGKPFFTTDTAAAEGAVRNHAEVIIKAGPADGVYSADPTKHKNARKYQILSVKDAIKKDLKVMDKAAFEICQKNKIPILVCKWQKGNVLKAVKGVELGTLVK